MAPSALLRDHEDGWGPLDSHKADESRQQTAHLILLSPSSPHALGDQTPFIFGDCSTDLQQKLIVRVLAHGPIDELDLASLMFKFLHEEHLMDVVAS